MDAYRLQHRCAKWKPTGDHRAGAGSHNALPAPTLRNCQACRDRGAERFAPRLACRNDAAVASFLLAVAQSESSPARGGGCNACSSAGGLLMRSFQSSPARGGGCNAAAVAAAAALSILQFQSSPARGGGCNFNKRSPCTARSSVSILTRPLGRVQPWRSRPVRHTPFRFNPHPPVGAGATHIHSIPHPQAARTRVANLRQYGLFTHAVQGRNIPRAWRNNS